MNYVCGSISGTTQIYKAHRPAKGHTFDTMPLNQHRREMGARVGAGSPSGSREQVIPVPDGSWS